MTALEQTNIMLAKRLDAAFENGLSHWALTFSDLTVPEAYATAVSPRIPWPDARGLTGVANRQRAPGGKVDWQAVA